MSELFLSDKQQKVLMALGRYKFLTYSQMQRLGIDKYRSNLSTILTSLRDRSTPLVRKIPHQMGVEAKHYLTSKGKEILGDLLSIAEEAIHCPKGIIRSDTQDEKHRTSIIDIHISLNLAAQEQGIEVLFCDRYFDTTGDNRRSKNLKSKTALHYESNKTFKPDMIFKIQTPKQEELYLLELENGLDVKKAIPKLLMHGKAILKGSANNVYNHPRAYRSIWVFEHNSTLLSVQEQLKNHEFFSDLHEYFLFKPLEEAVNESSFYTGWTNLVKKERKMWY